MIERTGMQPYLPSTIRPRAGYRVHEQQPAETWTSALPKYSEIADLHTLAPLPFDRTTDRPLECMPSSG